MNKKSILLLVTLLFVLVLSSCGENTETQTTAETKVEEVKTEEKQDEIKEEGNKEVENKEVENKEVENKEEVLVKIEELEMHTEVEQEPRKDGTKWSRFYVTNNSKYPLRSMTINYEPLQGEEISFNGFYSTVMPGGDSSYSYQEITKGEPTISTIQYVVYDGEKNYEITYNPKDQKYKQIEDLYLDMFKISKETVKVTVDKIPFSYETTPPDGLGMVYSTFKFRNESEYPLISVSLTAFSPEERSDFIYGSFDTPIEAGGAVPDITSFGAENLKPLKLLYIVEIDGKQYSYEYDYQLDLYTGNQLEDVNG